MIHETLFHLWNSFDNLESAEWTTLFELQEFLHPAEKQLLTRILDISGVYHTVVKFIKFVQKQDIEEVASTNAAYSKISRGLYLSAFANGLKKVLEPYRKAIVDLEVKFLQNPTLPLTYILFTLQKYELLLEDLKSMTIEVQNGNVQGCLIIDKLRKYTYSGNHVTADAAELIIQTINGIFYTHLCNWIIYGELVDVYNEFFIIDDKLPDNDFLDLEETSETTPNPKSFNELFKENHIGKPPIVRKFSINWNMVPSFIKEDLAESILFMGRIVWIVKNGPKKTNEEDYELKYRRDIWEGKDIDYYRKINNMGSKCFNGFEFMRVMEECRLQLTKYLWRILLDEGDVQEHLQLIRDYYALGRGELFQQFMIATETQLRETSPTFVVQNFNFIFVELAKKLYGDHDKSYQRFELIVPKSDVNRSNFWSLLRINFDIKWPLHVIFHPKAMELYNKLFSFLLNLKISQFNLNKLWQKQLASRQKIERKVWTLRHNLMFLIKNLQYYLQVDVIEANFSILLKAVKNANEFEDLIKLHHNFISNLLSKSFVLDADEKCVYKNKHRLYQEPAVKMHCSSTVYSIIMELLQVSDTFSQLALQWNDELSKPEQLELEGFIGQADSAIENLLSHLFNLCMTTNDPHIFRLLTQFNFNKFYSNINPNCNLSVLGSIY